MTGTVNGDRFYDFLKGTLIPMMQPFYGLNSHSVLIMDNCSVHHVSEVRQLFRSTGIVPLFLPSDSPDLNPIEEAFSYVEAFLRKRDDLVQAVQDPTDIIKTAFELLHNTAMLTQGSFYMTLYTLSNPSCYLLYLSINVFSITTTYAMIQQSESVLT